MEVLVKQNEMSASEKESFKDFSGSKGKIIVQCKITKAELYKTEGTIEDAREIAKGTFMCPNCQSTDCSQVIFQFYGKTNSEAD